MALTEEEKETYKGLAKSGVAIKRKYDLCVKEVQAINEQGKLAIKETDPRKFLTFKGVFRALEKYYSKFESLWDELIDHFNDPRFFPTSNDEKVYNAVRSAYYETMTNYEAILELERKTAMESKWKAPSTSFANQTQTLGEITITNDTSLEPIRLPTFDGHDILDWPSFRGVYASLIHDNEKLSPIKKFHYLVRSLKGPASTIVSAFPLEERYYTLAWDALKSNFENSRMLASSYLNKLLNFKPLQKCDTQSLKTFLTEISDNVAAFKKLTIPERDEFILFHLAVRNLDVRTREQFELSSKGTDFPKFDDLSKFIRDRVLALQLAGTSAEPSPDPKRSADKRISLGKSKSLVASDEAKNSSGRCVVCSLTTPHNLSHCKKFREGSVPQRVQWLRNSSGCKNCLAVHHSTRDCTSKYHCRHCSERHHTMLHQSNSESTLSKTLRSSSTNSQKAACISSSADATLASCTHSTVLLATALVEIRDARGVYHHVRLVIDSASQNSFITSRMMNQLGLKPTFFKRIISGIGDTPFSGAKGLVNCVLRSRKHGATPLKTNAVVLDNITTNLPNCDLPFDLYKQYSKFELADPQFFKSSRVDFLLGAELFGEVWTGEVHSVHEGYPKVFSTVFGYVVLGGFPQRSPDERSTTLFTSMPLDDLHDSLKRFWEIEEPCVTVPRNPDNEICEEHFRSTHYRTANGQYVVRLPFTELPPEELSFSAGTSKKMFFNLESRLAKHPQLREDYIKFMQEYIDLGHMTPTTTSSKYVIPHHAVLKEETNQIKLRVVFNASAPTRAGSLNDYLMVGPKLQTNIGTILLNYRVHPIVFSVDIVKFFRGILVDPEDRIYQHVYWRPDPTLPLRTYALNTVTYGQRCSPFLSIRVLHALKEDEGRNFPLASKVLIDDVYVDDYLTGSETVESALALQSELIGIRKRAAFH